MRKDRPPYHRAFVKDKFDIQRRREGGHEKRVMWSVIR